ncbi:JAB domain-containing protein [Sphingobium sp.]|uniref:JAB domain-containing protein n=1 Tax=Sphingobium sp. TaxID=1912891 RepID=UPI003BB68E94
MTNVHSFDLLILDPAWRPRHRMAMTTDWRTAIGHILALDAHWVALDQHRPGKIPPLPNPVDIALTRAFIRRLRPLDLYLADHMICADGQRFSFRAEGLL